MARFIDMTNLTEFFEKAIQPEPALTPQASHISHIYYGRKNASKYFFQPPGSKTNRKLWEDLRSISESHRLLQGHQLTVEVLRQAFLDAQTNAHDYNKGLGNQIYKAAIAYITLKHPTVDADSILKAAEMDLPEVKEELQMACKL